MSWVRGVSPTKAKLCTEGEQSEPGIERLAPFAGPAKEWVYQGQLKKSLFALRL